MLCFYPRLLRTFDDLPGHISLLVHCWSGCNLRCLGCHNHEELIARAPDDTGLTPERLLERLHHAGKVIDALLISGGEFLLNPLDEIVAFLKQVRAQFPGRVVIMSNGTFPDKIAHLLDAGLADGIHLDLKLPFHQMNPGHDAEVFRTVLGVVPSPQMCDAMLHSAEIVIRHNSSLSQIRTVRYPVLSDAFFDRIEQWVETLRARYDSQVPYVVNPFYPPSAS